MPDFNIAISYVLKNEDYNLTGAITLEPGGSKARYGINSLAHPEVDILTLTIEEAKEIFYREYWIKNNLQFIKDQIIATKLLDSFVNIGSKNVIRWLQKHFGLLPDGINGPKTQQAINYTSSKTVLNYIINDSILYYTARSLSKTNYPLEALKVRARKLP